MHKLAWGAGILLGALAVGCGGSSSSSPPPPTQSAPSGPTITIHGMAFAPLDMTVDAGTVISIVNQDSMAHTVTSEASDNAFAPGAVAGVSFDSGQVQPTTTSPAPQPGPGPYGYARVEQPLTGTSITIPANAPSGTVIPYYCQNHLGTMATPNGHITVH